LSRFEAVAPAFRCAVTGSAHFAAPCPLPRPARQGAARGHAATARPDVSPIFIFLTLLIIEANTTIPLLIDL
jgi:hypothetical protein